MEEAAAAAMAGAACSSSSDSSQWWLPFSPIGHGSTSRVSLSVDLRSFSLFASKSASLSSPHLPTLRHELRILQSLSSPFIVSLLGSDSSHHSSLSIFLEFMDSGSVSDLLLRLPSRRLPESQVRSISRSVLRGLHYLHSDAGIVHGDIKGSNILLNSSGQAKIADFGCAKTIGVRSGGIGGTPLWMAPEVVQGLAQEPPSDIWSFGCTVVEMLQGRPPFAHITDISALLFQLAFCEDTPPLPVESISPDAHDFLLRCLHPNPDLRWTAAQLLLHPFLADSNSEPLIESSLPCAERLSPRSTLSFAYSIDSEDDSDDATVSEFPAAVATPPASSCVAVADDGEWITVKCTGRESNRESCKPFMGGVDGSERLIRTRGCDVDLGAASFLKERRKVVG